MTTLFDLPTPAALVDLERASRNARAMRERARALGVRLRPHVKTHKCAEGALLQQDRGGGLTVSTLAEARRMASAGFVDLTWALPLPLCRLQEACDLAGEVARLGFLVDSREAAEALGREGLRRGRTFAVLLKVDCGYGRAGVDPEGEEGLAMAHALCDHPGLTFEGLLTHAGQAYGARSRAGVVPVAARERDVVVELAARMRQGGIPVGEVSVGSTPTVLAVDHLTGVTEMRPGNYLFFDAFQVALGSCALDACAFTVLATVIGAHPGRDAFVLDAGALALSKDPGATQVDPACGYGVVVAAESGEPLPGLRVASLSQEHAVVKVGPGGRTPAVGERVRIVPNHACLSAACFDRFHGLRGAEVVELWRPARGW